MNIQGNRKPKKLSKRAQNEKIAAETAATAVWTNVRGQSTPITSMSKAQAIAIFKMYIRNFPRYREMLSRKQIMGCEVLDTTITKAQISAVLITQFPRCSAICYRLNVWFGVRHIDGYPTEF